MRRSLALLLILQLLLPFSGIAQEKPVAAMGRVATLGKISDTQRGIISNRLESILAASYDLVSREQYERAEEAAFASLDLEKCTEEECIRKIQEILQVERLFILQIIRDERLTQLTLNLVTTDAKRIKEGICEACSLVQLYGRIEEMAHELIAEDLGRPPTVAAQPQPAVEEEGGGSVWWWYAGATILGLTSAAMFSQASDAHTQAQALANRDPEASKRYEDDRDQAAQVSLASALAAGLLLVVGMNSSDDSVGDSRTVGIAPTVTDFRAPDGAKLFVRLKW